MALNTGLRRWLRPVGWALLAIALVLASARAGILPNAAYDVLYWMVATPGRLTGKGERTALLYYRANCLPYRWPLNVARLATLGERHFKVEKTIFTCRMQ